MPNRIHFDLPDGIYANEAILLMSVIGKDGKLNFRMQTQGSPKITSQVGMLQSALRMTEAKMAQGWEWSG